MVAIILDSEKVVLGLSINALTADHTFVVIPGAHICTWCSLCVPAHPSPAHLSHFHSFFMLSSLQSFLFLLPLQRRPSASGNVPVPPSMVLFHSPDHFPFMTFLYLTVICLRWYIFFFPSLPFSYLFKNLCSFFQQGLYIILHLHLSSDTDHILWPVTTITPSWIPQFLHHTTKPCTEVQHHANLCLHLHMASSVSLHTIFPLQVSVSKFPLFIRTPVILA